MAAGDRSKRILQRVQYSLDDPSGIKTAYPARVYDLLNQIQIRLCEQSDAKQDTGTVSLIFGQELYAVPDGFIAEIDIIPSSTTPIVQKQIWEVAEIKRRGMAITNSGDPLYYYLWNSQIGFVTASGGTVTSNSTITLNYWRKPKTDGTETISDSIDPILDLRWDVALEMGAVWRLTKSGADKMLFEDEAQRQQGYDSASKGLTYVIPCDSGGL